MSDGKTVHGSCLCGAVTYEASGEPMFAGICYCRDCQKASGAPHGAFAAYPAGNLKLTGKTATFTNKADSGSDVTRHFCPTCGSWMMGQNTSFPDMRAVTVGTMDDASGFQPKLGFYEFRRHSWDPKAEGIPHFEKMPPM
jgi:hypothetical protein